MLDKILNFMSENPVLTIIIMSISIGGIVAIISALR